MLRINLGAEAVISTADVYSKNMPIASPSELRKAATYLSKNDAFLSTVIKRSGVCKITPHTDYYSALVDSIIGQQLSVKAASTIRQRFQALFKDSMPTPEQILQTEVSELRAIGFSNAKANYVHDLAEHILDGRIRFDSLAKQSNEQIMTELTDVKGIGEWTAHMFLIFCVGRLDVLPTGDLGIRNGVRKLYDLKDAPTPEQISEIALQYNWHPYESVAAWYIWRSLDNAPVI
jgi:DNA-3-methyladenine glycosylase II